MAEARAAALPSALLFDLDGTVADTDPLHLEVFRELFAQWGIEVDHAFFNKHISGRHNRDIFSKWMPGSPTLAQVDAESSAKEARFRDRARGRLAPLPGLIQLMEAARSAGIPMAAVTNAPRENAEFIIEQCGLAPFLQTLVLGSECARAKPFPEPYLEGLRRVGAAAAGAVVFEDSETGVRAGAAAGALVVGLTTGHAAHALHRVGATHCVPNFAPLSLPLLADLLRRRAEAPQQQQSSA